MPRLTTDVEPEPYWQTHDGVTARLYLGDVLDLLPRMPRGFAHCVVTSPPYWGLRDYGTAQWVGGADGCDHIAPFQPRSERPNVSASGIGRGGAYADEQAKGAVAYRKVCGKCGAKRVDQQLGGEDVPDCLGWATGAPCGECFVCHIVQLGRGLWHVMRGDATWWLNLGDSFGDGGDLLQVPAMCARALRADGWTLRQRIIWYAPNKMPESVTNRCTKSHEFVYMLAKSSDYYYDHVAIMEPSVKAGVLPGGKRYAELGSDNNGYIGATAETLNDTAVAQMKNKRDVWTVPTQGYEGAHFAVYSPRLITPMILAGTSERGCCAGCGAPLERVTRRVGGVPAEPNDDRDRSIKSNRNGIDGSLDGEPARVETTGWRPTCGCTGVGVEPCVVLDPFVGSGTTVATAVALGRRGVGVDLSETYLRENAVPRVREAVGAAQRVEMDQSPHTPPMDDVADAMPLVR